MIRPIVIAMGAMLLGTCALPASADIFRLRYKAGHKERFEDFTSVTILRSVDGEEEGVQSELHSVFEQQVKEVGDGSTTIEIHPVSVQAVTTPKDGKSVKSTDKGAGERIKINKRGLITDRQGLGDKPQEKEPGVVALDVLQRAIDGIQLPEADLSPGDGWQDKFDIPLTSDGAKGPSTPVDLSGTFVRWVKVEGERCAELKVQFKAPLKTDKPVTTDDVTYTADGRLLGETTLYFSPESGESIAEVSTYGVYIKTTVKLGDMTMAFEETLKTNTKTHRKD